MAASSVTINMVDPPPDYKSQSIKQIRTDPHLSETNPKDTCTCLLI